MVRRPGNQLDPERMDGIQCNRNAAEPAQRDSETVRNLGHPPGQEPDAKQMQEDHVHDVEEETDQVIAPRVEAEELVGETLDQPAKRHVDAAGERREGELDLFPAQTSVRVILENALVIVPIDEPVAEDR